MAKSFYFWKTVSKRPRLDDLDFKNGLRAKGEYVQATISDFQVQV